MNVEFQVVGRVRVKVWWLRFLNPGKQVRCHEAVKEEGRKLQALVKARQSPKEAGISEGPADLTASHVYFRSSERPSLRKNTSRQKHQPQIL